MPGLTYMYMHSDQMDPVSIYVLLGTSIIALILGIIGVIYTFKGNKFLKKIKRKDKNQNENKCKRS